MGFDPDQVAWGEQQLAGWAAQFGPKDLRRLAERVVDDIDPDGTLPDDKLQADRRHVTLHPTRDGGYVGEFRLTGGAGVKLQAVLGPLAKQRVNVTGPGDGRRVEEPDDRTLGQRMHDALEQLCDRILRTDTAVPDAGGTPATVIITLDLADLADKTGYAVASDGTLVPTEKRSTWPTRPRSTGRPPTRTGCRCSWAGPGQPDPALSLSPPQLPQHRLGLHHQPRRATRMATTLVGRP